MARKKKIEIIFNGVKETIEEKTTIAKLISIYNENDGGLIVEQNNRYIFPNRYETTFINEGDKIEFINPDFGG